MGLRGPLTRAAEQIHDDSEEILIPEHGIEAIDTLVLEEWNDYWRSKVSRFTDDVDMGAIRRLFMYRNEWVTLAREWLTMPAELTTDDTQGRLVAGSRNAEAVRMHPFAQRMDKLEAMMLPLEDRFGFSPLSRARLGIEVGSLHLTWQQLRQSEESRQLVQGLAPAGLPVASAELHHD